MSTADLFVLALAGALLLGVAIAIFTRRRGDRREPLRGRLDHGGLHPGLSSALSEIVAGHAEKAIDHLREVVREDTDAVEVYVLLGDLYRQIGQVERALRIHRSVLNRSGLTPEQRVAALVALGRDHESAGFLDRARQSFEEVAALAPEGARPLRHLRRLAERSGDWAAALEVQMRLARLASATDEDRKVLAFLHDRVGRQAAQAGDLRMPRKHFEKAIAIWPRCAPAHVHLGDLLLAQGRTQQAIDTWKGLAEADPARAWLVLDRLQEQLRGGNEVPGFEQWLRGLAEARPRDWRSQVALAEHLSALGRVDEAREALEAALAVNPGSVAVQRAAWRLSVDHGLGGEWASRVSERFGHGRAADRHACLHCRYRTDEPEWRCPHCHRWDSFVPDN